ncbi:MAG: penicillin-binding protein 2 [Candidatus Levybacteria bacterium]|nr:penicillin-binding protein 2 [Candidatus Levybacteria bacterium]
MSYRIKIAFFGLLFGFSLVILRLFYWQVVKADELSAMGKSQYGSSITISSERGDIKTSDGFPIATNKISYLVFANPKEIKEKDTFSQNISPLLEVDKASISAQLRLDRFWVPLKRGISLQQKEVIEKMKLPGVGFEEESVRFYPEASLAAQIVGFVGKDDSGEDTGYFGLEGYYDRQLKGKSITTVKIRDALGRPIIAQQEQGAYNQKGRSLVLHIDRAIQYLVEKKLNEAVEKYGASGGMVGIIEPKTGNIIAMASNPSFDQRHFQEYTADLYKNPFITNAYEPGSTFKALVMAAGINEKKVKADTKCPICAKPIEIGGYEIRTWNNTYIEHITMADVIMHSDNTGMVYVAQSLGLDTMLSYFQQFGIGENTGIDLQGEVAPILRERSQWYPIDLATAGFGQGISVTPIELLSGFAAIANNGIRMEPHVVSKIETEDGQTLHIEPKVLGKPISEKSAKVMTEILVHAVHKGEAQFARVKGYRIAGKTGTAQIPIEGHYDPHKTIASFIGFAPANDPKFAMLVIIDRPTTSIYGAETAAPLFFNISKDLLTYYDISPTEDE